MHFFGLDLLFNELRVEYLVFRFWFLFNADVTNLNFNFAGCTLTFEALDAKSLVLVFVCQKALAVLGRAGIARNSNSYGLYLFQELRH